MSEHSEKDLDLALEMALSTNPTFAAWLLRRTKFSDLAATYAWSRANHPWGPVSLEVASTETGERGTIVRDGETDVLVVYETAQNRRVALHIENKLAGGKFTPFQLALYNARAKSWKGNSKFGSYDDWDIVLLAPRRFYDRFPVVCKQFGAYVAHEDIAFHIPAFGQTA